MEKEDNERVSSDDIWKCNETVKKIYRELFEKLGSGFFKPFFNTFQAKQQILCPVSTSYWVRDGLSIGAIARLFPFPFFSRYLDVIADNESINVGSLGENIILLGRPVEGLFKSTGIKKIIRKIRKVQIIKTPNDINEKTIIVNGKKYIPKADEKTDIPYEDYGVVGRYIFSDKIIIHIYGCRSLGTYGSSLFITYYNNLVHIEQILSKLNFFNGEIEDNIEILVKVTIEEGGVQTPGIELKEIFYGNQSYNVLEQRWVSQVWEYDHIHACATSLNKDLGKKLIEHTRARSFYFTEDIFDIDFKLKNKNIVVKINNKNGWKTIQPKEAALLIIIMNLTEGKSVNEKKKVSIKDIKSEAESCGFDVKRLDKYSVLQFYKANR